MIRRPPISTRTDTRFPYTTLFRSSLFVRDWGAGRPVLFLAGWALPSDFWGYQMLALARQGYRAIAYDRRGHGRSADPGRGYDHDTLAGDLAAVIDGLNLDGVTIVRHKSEGRRVGNEGYSRGRSRWSPYT